jgi:hypothetical protein
MATQNNTGAAAGGSGAISQADAAKYKAIVDNLTRTLDDNPSFAEVLQLMTSGEMSFEEAIGAVISPEDLQAAQDEAAQGTPYYKRLEEKRAVQKQQAQAAQESAELSKKQEENMMKSMENVERYCQKQGLTEEETMRVFEKLQQWMQIWADGLVTEREAEDVVHLLFREDDLAAAHEQGLIAGRSGAQPSGNRRTFSRDVGAAQQSNPLGRVRGGSAGALEKGGGEEDLEGAPEWQRRIVGAIEQKRQ